MYGGWGEVLALKTDERGCCALPSPCGYTFPAIPDPRIPFSLPALGCGGFLWWRHLPLAAPRPLVAAFLPGFLPGFLRMGVSRSSDAWAMV